MKLTDKQLLLLCDNCECPECGTIGDFDDNGAVVFNDLSLGCRTCGMHFDPIEEPRALALLGLGDLR